jgi:hypothetical protein
MMAKKTEAVDLKYMANTLSYISNKKGTIYQDIAQKIMGS